MTSDIGVVGAKAPAAAGMRLGGSDEQDELVRLRSEKAAGDFWRGVFDDITDKTDREKVAAELHDYHFMMEQVPEVYCHITGQRMSKCNYYAHSVIAEADDYTNKLVEEQVAELTQDLKSAHEWQPIETAPKDGTWVLGWSASDSLPARISWGRNHGGRLAWCTAFCSFVPGYITHWIPMPALTARGSRTEGPSTSNPPVPSSSERAETQT